MEQVGQVPQLHALPADQVLNGLLIPGIVPLGSTKHTLEGEECTMSHQHGCQGTLSLLTEEKQEQHYSSAVQRHKARLQSQ